jgi:4-diphosphocytidyl-2-C-methyl-D-erythritol kinase
VDRGFAPAKINLALHVTGRREDGYHLLDSLVVFAGIGDSLSATVARTLTLSVRGAFAPGVPTDGTNLVLRAAEALRTARGVRLGATIRLTKALPPAAGLGGGSSDAAAAIRLLSALWRVAPLDPGDPAVLAIGADVPVCLSAPAPVRMQGAGEVLSPLAPLPPFAVVLVNPRAEVPTRAAFAALARRDNPPMDLPAAGWRDLDAFVAWLARQRNDLSAPAEAIAPEVGRALARLRAQPGILHAVMSGSGATCVGLTRDLGAAKAAAKAIQIAEQGWWVAPAPVLSAGAPAAQAMRSTT